MKVINFNFNINIINFIKDDKYFEVQLKPGQDCLILYKFDPKINANFSYKSNVVVKLENYNPADDGEGNSIQSNPNLIFLNSLIKEKAENHVKLDLLKLIKEQKNFVKRVWNGKVLL